MKRTVSFPCAWALAGLVTLALPGPRAEIIGFDSERWVRGAGDVVDYQGRTCLMGSAFLPHAAFENGVIEFDVLLDGSRGYPGITFRATSPTAYEHVYLRPHAGLRHDGMQYAPAFGPGSDWQLYHGPGYTTSVTMPAGEWIHVRVEVLGRRARVFYGDAAEPVLRIDDLKHDPVAGPVGIRSARNPSARFSNFSVTKTDELDFDPPVRPRPPRGLITEWELSQPFKAADVDGTTYPAAGLLERIEWRRVTTEAGGLLNLSRHVARSANGETDLAFARVWLEAQEPETRRFSFGYSDFATIFLNRVPIFSGNASYQSRSADFAGVIGLEDSLHLPLRQGSNELMIAVVESFGGWGLLGQDNGDDYLRDGMSELWRLEVGNRLPESVAYDPARELLYVTHYFRGGNEYVSKVALHGEVLVREWISGLERPTGLAVYGDRLWVVDRRHLVEIDPEAGTVVDRHPIPDAVFPNDVAFDGGGAAYVTDTRGDRIYRFDEGEFEVWLEGAELGNPNGILVDGGHLLFGGSNHGELWRVSLADRTIEPLASLGEGANVDGLCSDGKGSYVVSDFNGRVYRLTPDGTLSLLLDTTASGATSADLTVIPGRGLLVVPGLFDNRLTAYRFDAS